MRKQTIVVILALTILAIGIAIVFATSVLTINNTGIITEGLAAYQDPGCTIPLTSISWGSLTPGQITTYQFYLKNIVSVPIANLVLTDPTIPASLSLAWNDGGLTVQPGASITATLTLTVSSSATGTPFAFDITITGT
jgi:uncharacterized repeat protein (TIGR01451 family)